MFVFFCFQGEDGIRGAQESRGLGDVYKRQAPRMPDRPPAGQGSLSSFGGRRRLTDMNHTRLSRRRLFGRVASLLALTLGAALAGQALALSLIHI